jgi:hypothetical protein
VTKPTPEPSVAVSVAEPKPCEECAKYKEWAKKVSDALNAGADLLRTLVGELGMEATK